MDELVGPSLIQGDHLDIPDENEADALNDETFGDFEEGGKYTWDEDQGREKPPLPTKKAESRSDVSKIQEEYSQMTLESLWKKPDLGDRALVQGDDILSSSPFSQSSVWKSPERPSHSILQGIWMGHTNQLEKETILAEEPKVMSVAELEEQMTASLPPTTAPLTAPPTAPPTSSAQLPPDLTALMSSQPVGRDHMDMTSMVRSPDYFRTPYPIPMVPGGGPVGMGPMPGYPPMFPGHPPELQRMPHPFGTCPPLFNTHPMYRQGPPRPPHQHGHMMQHQRMRYHNDKDGGYSSPPHRHHHGNPSPRPWTWNGFMNERERERFKDIHLSQLQCDDPFNEDYYYQKFLLKSCNVSANVSETTPQSEESHKRLVVPDVKKEEKGTYTPMEFEGTLGKLTKSSVNTPRQVLMVVRSEGELVEKEIEKELNSQQKRRKLFMTIEKMYSLVLEVEELDHKMPNLSDEEKFTSSQRRETLVEQLFRMTGAKTPGETWKKSDDMFFLQLMFIRKGKLLMGRLLSLFDQAKCRCVFGALMRNMTAVIRRDKADCVLQVLLKPLLSVMSTMRLSEVLSNVTALAKGPPQAHPPRSALVMAGSCSFGANLLVGLIGRGNSTSLENDTPTDERKEWEDLHFEIKEKLAEFQMELDTVLRAHNGPTPDNTSVE